MEEIDGAGSGICTLVEEICSLSRSCSAKPARLDLPNATLVLSMSAKTAHIFSNAVIPDAITTIVFQLAFISDNLTTSVVD